MHVRSKQLEIIDMGPSAYTKEEYFDCLTKLDKIGRWLGGDRATLKAFSKSQPPKSILDVGCGGGLFTHRLAKLYPDAHVLGIDVNPYAIEFARKGPLLPHLSFEHRDKKELHEPTKSFDIVTSTLVCHHIADDELADFIKNACRIAKSKVILNDLHRHRLALFLFKLITPFCFRNRLVRHDGPLSILRGFTYQEWTKYLEKAGLDKSQFTIRWHWAFRWIIEIDTQGIAS